MAKKTLIPAIMALGSAAAINAALPADSIPGTTLDVLTVTGNSARQRIENVRIGAERLELGQLSKLPSFGGENDIIKSISLLPGVRSEGDGGGGFEVRGGSFMNCALCIIMSSCEKTLDFKYHDIEPLTVIEGELTDMDARISVTLTTPMDEQMDRTHLTDATMTTGRPHGLRRRQHLLHHDEP